MSEITTFKIGYEKEVQIIKLCAKPVIVENEKTVQIQKWKNETIENGVTDFQNSCIYNIYEIEENGIKRYYALTDEVKNIISKIVEKDYIEKIQEVQRENKLLETLAVTLGNILQGKKE